VQGVQGKARQIPGSAAQNKDGFAAITSVPGARAGDSSAGRCRTSAARVSQVLAVNET